MAGKEGKKNVRYESNTCFIFQRSIKKNIIILLSIYKSYVNKVSRVSMTTNGKCGQTIIQTV